MEYARTPAIPENLRFISIEDIEAMRHAQAQAVIDAGASAIEGLSVAEILENGLTLRDEAQEALKNEIDAAAELYVADHLEREDNEELYDGCVDLVKRYSVLNMPDSEWRAGIPNEDGEYDRPETSGQHRLWEELSELIAETTDDDEEDDDEPEVLTPAHDMAEVARLQHNVELTRRALAELSIKRRRLMTKSGSKKAKALAEQYAATQYAYDRAKMEIGQLSIEAMQAAEIDENEIIARVRHGALLEAAAFTQAEQEFIEHEGGKVAKFTRWYAKKRRNMIGVNMAVGVGTGLAIGKLVKYGFIAAVPGVGIGVLAGARVGKSLLTAGMAGRAHLNNEFEKRQAADWQKLESGIDAQLVGATPDSLANLYVNASSQLANERIDADTKANKKRAIISGAVAGIATAGGALIADQLWGHSGGGSSATDAAPTPKTDLEILTDAGATREQAQAIIENPEAFERMVANPEKFAQFQEAVAGIKAETGLTGDALSERVHDTLALADYLEQNPPTVVSTIDPSDVASSGAGEVFAISNGGGIIKDIIRPMATTEGVSLTSSQETAVWQAVRSRFGDDLFTNNTAFSRGADQWISQSGQTTLRPEVAEYMKQQITTLRSS